MDKLFKPWTTLFPAPPPTQISKLFSSSKGWDGWTKEIKPHSMTCHPHFGDGGFSPIFPRGLNILSIYGLRNLRHQNISYPSQYPHAARINIYVYTATVNKLYSSIHYESKNIKHQNGVNYCIMYIYMIIYNIYIYIWFHTFPAIFHCTARRIWVVSNDQALQAKRKVSRPMSPRDWPQIKVVVVGMVAELRHLR